MLNGELLMRFIVAFWVALWILQNINRKWFIIKNEARCYCRRISYVGENDEKYKDIIEKFSIKNSE